MIASVSRAGKHQNLSHIRHRGTETRRNRGGERRAVYSKGMLLTADPPATWDNLYFPPKDYSYFEGLRNTPVNAAWMVDAAILAYGKSGPEAIGPLKFSRILKDAGFEHQALIGDWSQAPSGTQGFLACNEKFAIVAFRGTEKEDWHDLAADLAAAPVEENPAASHESILNRLKRNVPLAALDVLLDPAASIVHFGFQLALNAVWLEVNRWLDRKSTRLNSSHIQKSRMPSSA